MKSYGSGRVGSFQVLLPLIFSFTAFVLAMIALFAGTGPQQQQLEEYHIIAINMSGFGKDLLPSASSDEEPEPKESDSGGIGGFLNRADDKANDLKDDATDRLNDILNGAADKLADELGISQWYSFHVMNVCQGDFAPNITVSGAWYNTTNCTAREPGVHFNLTEALDKEIDVGPLDLNPADLKLPDFVQEAIDLLNKCLMAMFIFYVLGSAFSGLGFLLAVAALVLGGRESAGGTNGRMRKTLALANAGNALLGALALMIGSAVSTAVAKKGAAKINESGDDAGISAVPGHKFIVLSWVAFGLMGATLLFWTLACWSARRAAGGRAFASDHHHHRTYVGEKPGRPSASSDRGLVGGFFRRNR